LREDYLLRDYWRVIRRSWKTVVCLGVGLGILSGLVAMFFVPRQWRSSATILFELPSSRETTLASLTDLTSLGRLATQFGVPVAPSSAVAYSILTSRSLRATVAEVTNLTERVDLADEFEVNEFLGKTTLVQVGDAGAVTLLVTVPGTPRGLIARLDDDMEARELARDIAAAHVTALQEMLSSFALTRAQRKCEFLQKRVAETEREVDDARAALAAAQRATGVVMPAGDTSVPDELIQLAKLEKEMILAEGEAQAATDKLGVLGRELSEQDEMVVGQVISSQSGVLDPLKSEMTLQQAELAVLASKGYGTEHPEYRAGLQRLSDLKASYEDELSRGLQERQVASTRNTVRDRLVVVYAQTQADLAAGQARLAALRGLVEETRDKVEALPGSMQVVGARMLDVELKSQVYAGLVSAYEMARVEAEEEAPRFEVLDPAFVPKYKLGPSVAKTGLFFTFLGLLLAVIVVLGRNSVSKNWPPEPTQAGPAQDL